MKYAFFFPYETAQAPFFELLGRTEEHKRLFVYDRGHTVPQNERTKEVLAWLNKYLGEVEH